MTLEERLAGSSYNVGRPRYSGVSQFLKDTSKLNVDTIPLRYQLAGKLGSLKDTSKLNIDTIPSRYAPK